MNEFDELVSSRGVIMAGRFGPDGRVAEHKSKGLYIDDPAAMEMAHWFCSAATMMFTAMSAALDQLTHSSSFDTTSWLPMSGWSYSGGDYSIAVHGDSFVVAQSAKVKSLDELAGLLRRLNS